MGWIRQTDAYGIQAVHKVDGKEVARRYFSFRRYGEYEYAEHIARRWLRWCKHVRPWHELRRRPLKNKTQDYPVGVSRSYSPKRCAHYMHVHWHDGTTIRNKGFYIGKDDTATPADFRLAERVAIAFRCEYEACRKAGIPMNDKEWLGWKKRFAGRALTPDQIRVEVRSSGAYQVCCSGRTGRASGKLEAEGQRFNFGMSCLTDSE